VADLLGSASARIYPVGRLDFATSGVLLATNDGDFANAMLHPRGGVPKTYVLKVKGIMGEEDLERWATGIDLEDGRTLPAEVRLLRHEDDKTWFEITIREGRNQQIRRMGDATHFPVMRLARVSFAGISHEGLRPGDYRSLTADELEDLRKRYGVPKRIRGAVMGEHGEAPGHGPRRRMPKREGDRRMGLRPDVPDVEIPVAAGERRVLPPREGAPAERRPAARGERRGRPAKESAPGERRAAPRAERRGPPTQEETRGPRRGPPAREEPRGARRGPPMQEETRGPRRGPPAREEPRGARRGPPAPEETRGARRGPPAREQASTERRGPPAPRSGRGPARSSAEPRPAARPGREAPRPAGGKRPPRSRGG
jgi:23S rRNA pseudouridine2605 synthase